LLTLHRPPRFHYSAVVTAPGKSPPGQDLSELSAGDADAAVLLILQGAKAAMTARDIKAALQAAGMPKDGADRAWPGVQRRIRSHDHVVVDGRTYRWAARAREIGAVEALQLLAKNGLAAARKTEFLAIVAAALASPPDSSSTDLESAARRRQAQIDARRALAELASDVEELLANEVTPEVMVRQVRARAKRSDLEPIERAGAETTFDRSRHEPVGPAIRDGAPVIVVRPGYVWKAPSEDVLIRKAVVEE
jgi:hypothetical protein